MASLLDLFNGGGAGNPGSLYAGLLTPEQNQALAYRGLLGAAGAFGEGAMPSRLPIPIGAVLGKAAAAMGSAQDEGATTALTALLRGTQAKKLQSEIDYAKQLGPSIEALNSAVGGLSGGGPTPGYGATPSGSGAWTGLAKPAAGGYSYDDMVKLATDAGFAPDKAPIMAATAMGESSGNPNAFNGKGENSYGLTQINADAHGPVAKEALNPKRAFELAYQISKGGTDFSPWTVYKTGAYKQYLPQGGAAAAPMGGGGLALPDPTGIGERGGFGLPGGAAGTSATTETPFGLGSPEEALTLSRMAPQARTADARQQQLQLANAYADALRQGFTGTIQDFAASQSGPQGPSGDIGPPGPTLPPTGMASGLLTPGGPLTRQSPLPPIQAPPSMTAPQGGMLTPPSASASPPGMLGAGGPPAAMPALPGAAPGALPQVNPAYGNVLSAIAALRAKAGLAGISGNPFEGYVEAITKSPAYAAQLETAKRGAGLPWIAPEKEAEKSVELRYAGQIAEAVAAGQLPSQVVLKNVEAQNDLRNRLASGPVPTQISFDKDGVGTITPIRGGAEAAASAAGGVTRAQEQAKADVAAGTAPGIAGSTKYAETAATQDAAARAQAIAARNTLPLLDEAKQQLAGAGIFSGPAANLNLTLAQVATVAGWPNEKLVNTQTYIQQAGARAAEILRSGAYGTGSGISQNDLRAADKLANGDITLDIRSIQRILDLAERKAGRDIETFNAIAQKRDPATAIEHPPRLIGTTNTGKRVYRMPDGSQQVQD